MELSYGESGQVFALIQETALFLWKEWPRDMEAVGLNQQDNFSLAGTCPHCKRASAFLAVTARHTEVLVLTQSGPKYRHIAAMQCQACKAYILAQVTHYQNELEYRYEAHFPLGKPNDNVALAGC